MTIQITIKGVNGGELTITSYGDAHVYLDLVSADGKSHRLKVEGAEFITAASKL